MRGSIKTQISAALKCCARIGMSRHEQKQKHGGKSPFIHSVGTLDKVIHRLWPLQSWLQNQGLKDLELLTNDLVQAYLEDRFTHHATNGNARKTFQVEISAMGNLERGLGFFSQEKRSVPMSYDFSIARKHAAKLARKLPKTTASYTNRALAEPLELIAALEFPHHRLMAMLQLYCGCRTEGVGAPRRHAPDKNLLTMKNFQDEDGQLIPQQADPVTGVTVQPFWTKEKGGKLATKFCPIPLAKDVMTWLKAHPKGLGDRYERYLAAINKAMLQTGQYNRGRGTHSLRFCFAQQRYIACIFPFACEGMGDEEAKLQVSHEMSHNRPDITRGYLR